MTRMRLRYPGTCVRCGASLAAGAEAIHDRASRTVSCIACPTEPTKGGPTALPEIEVGVAGASAQREFDRRKANREARIKGRFGSRVGGWITALTDEPQSTRAWARGASGERELAEALRAWRGSGSCMTGACPELAATSITWRSHRPACSSSTPSGTRA